MKTNLLASHLDSLKKIFKKHKIEKAYVFGSVLNEELKKNSDVDFLIQFQNDLTPLEKGTLWWSLHDSLRDLLGREIDLLTESSLKNPYFIQELNQTKQLIYG